MSLSLTDPPHAFADKPQSHQHCTHMHDVMQVLRPKRTATKLIRMLCQLACKPHLAVDLIQGGQYVMYKGPLGVALRGALLELPRSGLEVYVTPQPPGKLLGVKCSPIDITVQLSKGLQCERPARLASSKCHVTLDRVYLQDHISKAHNAAHAFHPDKVLEFNLASPC